MENWKDVEGYEGLYQVSNLGRIKSLPHVNYLGRLRQECILGNRLSDRGYHTAVLYNNGKPKSFRVHRLVANAFIDNPNNKPHVNHIDGVKSNNLVSNLEWVTISENQKHAFKIGLNKISCDRDSRGKFVKKQ
jgi:hypothetical protein